MAESRHEAGSAIVSSGGKEDTIRKIKWDPLVIIFIEVIVLAVIVLLFCWIKKYANTYGCGSAFWEYLSNSAVEFASALLGGVVAIAPAIIGVQKFRTQGRRNFTNLIAPLGVFLVGTLSFLCLFTFFNILGAVEKEKEIKSQLTQNSNTQTNSILMSSNNEQGNNEIKEIITYNIAQDLYMENRALEDYYSGEITTENSKIVKAKILYNNLNHNKPEGSASDNYHELLETADYKYETYKYKKEYADKRNNTSEEWFEDRIESLQESLNGRIEAEKECENPKNERPIAAGFRDEGDEYFGRGNQNMAINAYEKSANWFMIAICHAAAIGDYEEMNRCKKMFEALGEEVEKLNKIDLSRRNKIIESIEVYDIFVGWMNEGK